MKFVAFIYSMLITFLKLQNFIILAYQKSVKLLTLRFFYHHLFFGKNLKERVLPSFSPPLSSVFECMCNGTLTTITLRSLSLTLTLTLARCIAAFSQFFQLSSLFLAFIHPLIF